MGIGEKLKGLITVEDEYDDDEQLVVSKEEAEGLSPYEKRQIEGSSAITASTNIVLFEPRNFDEAEEIGRHIKNKRACCINLHRMPSQYRQRIIDFLSGVVYGLDGSIKKVGENVILCSPKNLQVGGDIDLGVEDY